MFIRSAVFCTLTLVVLFLISTRLTIITLIVVCPIVVVFFVYGLVMRKLTKEQQQKKAELGQIAEEAISNMRTVKAFACESHEVQKFSAKNKECYNVGMKQAGYEAFISFFIGFAMNSAMAAIIYYGADLVDKGELNIGDISMYLLYMIQLIFNFLTIGMVIGNVFKMFGASEKIIKMMKYLPTVNSLGGDTIP